MSRHALLVLLAIYAGAFPFRSRLGRPVVAVIQVMKGRKTVGDRLAQYGDAVHMRLGPHFDRVKVAYLHRRVTLVGLKGERILQAKGKLKPSEIDEYIFDTGGVVGASNGKKTTKIKIHINADGKNLHAYPID